MGLLDEILKQAGGAGRSQAGAGAGAGALGSIAEMVMKNPQIIAAALSMLNPKDPSVGGGGGLADIIGAFNKGGLGDIMSSWVGGGPNKPVDPGALASVLGPDILGQFAQEGGRRTSGRRLGAGLDPARARQPDDAPGPGAAGERPRRDAGLAPGPARRALGSSSGAARVGRSAPRPGRARIG